MIDSISISYDMGATLVKADDTEPVEGTTYLKWDYQQLHGIDPALSPSYEGWFEKNAETGKYILSEDISVDPEKEYYTYELIEQVPAEGDDPSSLGWYVMTTTENVGDPSCSMGIQYDL